MVRRAVPVCPHRFSSHSPIARWNTARATIDRPPATNAAHHVPTALSTPLLPTPALLTLDGRWAKGGDPDYERMFNTCLNAAPGSLPGATLVVGVL
ncbi:hypothetical protein [Streptomyces sp. NPDC050804]|uniref:hypothetical protein n=1 Tax=Streptomyces sp. NPDC050804 TaxID=3154745 RepID=UPI0034339C46